MGCLSLVSNSIGPKETLTSLPLSGATGCVNLIRGLPSIYVCPPLQATVYKCNDDGSIAPTQAYSDTDVSLHVYILGIGVAIHPPTHTHTHTQYTHDTA